MNPQRHISMLALTPEPIVARLELNQQHDAVEVDSVAPFRNIQEEEIPVIFRRAIYQEVIASDAFQRLKDIHFLGAIDYVVPTGGWRHRHTRFQHSLRVAQLALHFARLCNLNESEEKLLVVGALLHDIGHAPLSHSLEPTFKRKFELTHHSASEKIIRGEVPIGHLLAKTLRANNISPEDVLALIDGVSFERAVEAFRCVINIDTIEAISRSYTYIANRFTNAQPARIVSALVRKNAADIQILDDFWRLKDTVYNHLIGSKLGIVADYICQKYMEENSNMWMGVYFHSETTLRKKHPELFKRLRELKTNSSHPLLRHGTRIPYQRRHFLVDDSVTVKTYDDIHRRYKQTKSSEVMEF